MPTTPYVVYRYYDLTGNLLYVGYTENFIKHDKTHRYAGQWGNTYTARTMRYFRDAKKIDVATLLYWQSKIDKTVVTKYPTMFEAYEAERVAIRDESPIFNKAAGRNYYA
jgi:hypothetical protein